MKTLKEFGSSGNLLIAAHRGSSGNAPENTLSAFRLAFEEGANMIETDLQFTSDNHIVAVHDLKHFNGLVIDSTYTLNDYKKLDAGGWFSDEFKGEKISTLDEILDFCKDKMYLNLELKVYDKPLEQKQIEILLKIVHDYSYENYLMFSSFNPTLLNMIKQVDSLLATAVINNPRSPFLPSEICPQTNADAYICSLIELNDEINQDALRNNIFLGVYSVDNEEQFKNVMRYKVAAIGTNYPKLISDLVTGNI